MCAYFFDAMFDIIVRCIIGWDDEARGPCEHGGIFCVPSAYIAAVEEQGRCSLHAHILVWIKSMFILQEELHSRDLNIKCNSKRKLVEMVDNVISTELIHKKCCYRKKFSTLRGPFLHECRNNTMTAEVTPEVVDDQSIRNLHSRGERKTG